MAEASTSSRPATASPSPVQTPVNKPSSIDDSTLGRPSAMLEERDVDAIGEDEEEHTWYSAVPIPSLPEPSSQETQLPTPKTSGQVHSTVFQPFYPNAGGLPESPLALIHSRPLAGLPGANRLRSRSQETSSRRPHLSQPMTPAASPARRGSTPLTNHSQILQSPISELQFRIKTESPPITLAPAPEISPSRASRSSQPTPEPLVALDLSSPFTERPVLLDVETAPTVVAGLATIDGDSMQTNAAMSTHIASTAMAEATVGSATSRSAGGELERLRNEATSREVAHKADLDARRPEYFKRLQKEERAPAIGIDPSDQGLGITETPARGRRLQLFDFQTTSAESFEESLMTHGYGTYGEPRTPQKPLGIADGLSQDALNWLAFNTPAPSNGIHLPSETPGGRPTEKELKKRKRLEAFQNSTARACAKLYPAEVEGFGRILLNVPPEDVGELLGTPSKRRNLGKKKRGTPAPDKRVKQEMDKRDGLGAESLWLDSEVPWAQRREEMEGEIKAQEEDRMMWIDKYFSHDTDSDERLESDDDDEFPMTWEAISGRHVEAPRPGRGKTVAVKSDPNVGQQQPLELDAVSPVPPHVHFATDPADALTALLGKRSVRALALRKRRQASAGRDNQDLLACDCGDDSEEKQAVQCDDCQLWYHLDCIGVRDEAELGGKDDAWFCPSCEEKIQATVMRQQQPTFFVAQQSPVRRDARSDVPLFSSSSPGRDWSSSGGIQTPVQPSSHHRTLSKSRRSIWDDSPGTSRSARLFNSGASFSDSSHQSNNLDSSSPSQPFPAYPSFATPKNSASGTNFMTPAFGVPWAINTGAVHTPRNVTRGRHPSVGSTGYGFVVGDSAGLGMFGQGGAMQAYAWQGDKDDNDTPIRRAPPRSIAAGGIMPYGQVVDSPLAQKGQTPRLSGGLRSGTTGPANSLPLASGSHGRS